MGVCSTRWGSGFICWWLAGNGGIEGNMRDCASRAFHLQSPVDAASMGAVPKYRMTSIVLGLIRKQSFEEF